MKDHFGMDRFTVFVEGRPPAVPRRLRWIPHKHPAKIWQRQVRAALREAGINSPREYVWLDIVLYGIKHADKWAVVSAVQDAIVGVAVHQRGGIVNLRCRIEPAESPAVKITVGFLLDTNGDKCDTYV